MSRVRGISRRVLARHATNQVTAKAACAGRGQLWNKLEADMPWKGGVGAAVWQAVEVIAPLCAHCPALEQCATWASTEEYSGYAAGTLYLDGSPVSVGERPEAVARPA